MAAIAPITPNPTVLVWARRESGYASEHVARRLGVKEGRIAEWESGDRVPTIRQLGGLAKMYHRPLGVFFRPKPPTVPALATEYRRLPGLSPGHESPELRLAIRKMSNRRETMVDFLEETGERLVEFRLETYLNQEPSAVAERLREALAVSMDVQLGWSSEWAAWSAWREAVENLGVLVFQFPGVALEEVRGISLLHWPLPVAGVNSKETSPEARAFTLIHEVVNLMLAAGKEEQPAARETRRGPSWLAVERFAEEAASHVLIPERSLREFAGSSSADHWDVPTVRRLARKFRVTPLAMATRLRSSDLIGWNRYREWKRDWEAHVARLKPRSGGFATPVGKTLGRAGLPFTKLVLEAMAGNRITSDQAARYLDLKFEHFRFGK